MVLLAPCADSDLMMWPVSKAVVVTNTNPSLIEPVALGGQR